MAIPIAYNLRNLTVRKTTTLMTALGIGLTVAVLVAVLALVAGLRTAFEVSGNPLQMLVLRKGSTAELNSGVTRELFQNLKFKLGIAKTETGEPMASLEMVTVINLANPSAPSGMNLTLRGLLPVGFDMRGVKISEGRLFRSGQREIVVGKSIAKRLSRREAWWEAEVRQRVLGSCWNRRRRAERCERRDFWGFESDFE